MPMAELRSKLADMGYTSVVTILHSGNIIVSSDSIRRDEVADSVRRLLCEEFDANVPCIARSADQVREIVELNPFREIATDTSRHLVNFLSRKPDSDLAAELMEEDHGREVVSIHGTEAHVWTPEGVKAMTLSFSYLEKRLGVVATARNWNTLVKICAKL